MGESLGIANLVLVVLLLIVSAARWTQKTESAPEQLISRLSIAEKDILGLRGRTHDLSDTLNVAQGEIHTGRAALVVELREISRRLGIIEDRLFGRN